MNVRWCVTCGEPRDCDARGCIKCADRRELMARYAKARRSRLALAGACINGDRHDKPRPGKDRCDWCVAVNYRGISAVLADPNAPQRPRDYGKRGRK